MFGDRESRAYLTKFAWTKIVRHQMVDGFASPDDATVAGYWAARRRRRSTPPLDRDGRRLITRQRGRCPLCGDLLLHADTEPQHPDEWEQDHRDPQGGAREGAHRADRKRWDRRSPDAAPRSR